MTRPLEPQPAFEGFTSPSFTQVPDELFDVLMPTLSDCELRVLLYIIRRTFGFKRTTDNISLSQMVSGITTRDGVILDRGTGLSKATVARGLASLRAKGVILATHNTSTERGNEATTYRLRFKTDTPETAPGRAPLSQPRDTGYSAPLVSAVRQGLSRQRDTQQTVRQHTDFEFSKGKRLVDNTEAEQITPYPGTPEPDQSASAEPDKPLATLMANRVRRLPGGEEDIAIRVTIEQFAQELGDQASRKSSVTRALNLFHASGVNKDAFIDVLYRAKGEVRDRRQHPGKAPLPRNQMAYLFAVAQDWLGEGIDAARQPADQPVPAAREAG